MNKMTFAKFTAATLSAAILAACSQDKPADSTAAPAAPANTGEKVVRIATESNFKPFSYMDASGELKGFEIDLAHAMCAEMKVTCQINSFDWDGLIPSLQSDKFDAVMAGMSITEERLNSVDFSDPYFDNKLILIGKKGDTATIADVDGKTVAAQQATVASQYLEKNHPKAKLKVYDKQDNAYLDLSAGRAEYMLSDIVPASDWLTTDAGKNFEIKGAPIDSNDKIGVAVKKGNAELKDAFSAAIASLKANGKYAEIAAKHLGETAATAAANDANTPADKTKAAQ